MKQSLLAVALVAVLPGAAFASADSSVPTQGTAAPAPALQLTPEQEAALSYDAAMKHQEKAEALRKNASAETDAKKGEKLAAQSKKEYEKALRSYEDATTQDAKMFQAFSGIGYTQRKLGNYDLALAAYDHALQLEPKYSPAIEYRGEAYLGLNRVDDAKAAYTALFASDRKRADELHSAMKQWLESRRKDPAGLSAAAIEDFSNWLTKREEIAAQTSALVRPKSSGW